MSIPYFSTSVYPTQTEPHHSMAAFHSSHAFSHACAPAMQYACSSSSPRIYPDGSQKRGEKKSIRGACFWFISLHFSSLRSFACIAANCTQIKIPVQYLVP